MPGQKRLPYALSDDQVRQLLGHVRNAIPRTCLATMYACGLRIGEATTLEIRSIDRANQVLRIIGGPKGVFASVTRRRAREALTDAQQRLRPNPETGQRTVAA